MKRIHGPALRATLGTSLLVACGGASAQNYLHIRDDATGQVLEYTHESGSFRLDGDGRHANVHIGPNTDLMRPLFYPFLDMLFAAPPGERLEPGFYPHVGCPRSVTGRAAGLHITEDNPRCPVDRDVIWGWFTIRQIAYDPEGRVTALEAAYSQRVGSATAPAWHGVVRVNTSPLSFTLNSTRRSWWGAIDQVHHGDAALFALAGTADGVHYTASLIKDYWSVMITPPDGQALQVGRYATRAQASEREAGVFVARGTDEPRFCSQSEGTLDVHAIDFDDAGAVKAMHATVSSRCGRKDVPLTAVIRYHR